VEFTTTGFQGRAIGGEDTRRAVIECDGHDFHERTKEQARYDRRRDREVQGFGLPILRFTGSEIYADAVACGHQVLRFFVDAAERDFQRALAEFAGSSGEPDGT
jgi:very-short-patch-repair endonuclease